MAIVFCLLFAWIGRNLYRVRQQDAAVETLLQAGGTIYVETYGRIEGPPGTFAEPSDPQIIEPGGDLLLRSIGWQDRPPIAEVKLRVDDTDDPAAAEATAALALLPEIRIVSLTGLAFDDASLDALNRLPDLEALRLDCTEATADGLKKLVTPQQIEYLYVRGFNSRDFASGAGALRQLRKIDFLDVRITQADVAALASLPDLEELRLERAHRVGENVLTPLADARKLRILEVSGSKPYDAEDLRALGSLPNLERLVMQPPLREPDLALLVPAKKLRYLDARAVPEDAGRAFSLEHPECVIRLRGPTLGSVYLLNGERTESP